MTGILGDFDEWFEFRYGRRPLGWLGGDTTSLAKQAEAAKNLASETLAWEQRLATAKELWSDVPEFDLARFESQYGRRPSSRPYDELAGEATTKEWAASEARHSVAEQITWDQHRMTALEAWLAACRMCVPMVNKHNQEIHP